MKTHTVFDTPMPVLASLPDGFVLVAHSNGPAISDAAGQLLVMPSTHEDEDVPANIMEAAIQAYVKLTWPGVVAGLRG